MYVRRLLRPRPSARAMATATPPPAQPNLALDEERRCITITPGDGQPAHTAVVVGPIHGLGDSARGWLEGALALWTSVPHCKMILPDAPIAPVTLNGGFEMPSWYDIKGDGDRFSEDCDGLDESRARISALIEEEMSAAGSGVTADRIVVAGFSQGGALSLVSGLQCDHTLAGVLVMSGYLAGAPTFELSAAARNVPVLHLHGDSDPMVKVEWARETRRRMESFAQ